jgi:hypothetical protein
MIRKSRELQRKQHIVSVNASIDDYVKAYTLHCMSMSYQSQYVTSELLKM